MAGESAFRVGFVPGVTLTKWSRVWAERRPDRALDVFHVDAQDPAARIRDGSADVVFARLPISVEGLHAIPLYGEQPVVVLPKEHALAERSALVLADLEGETRFDLDPALDLPTAVEVVTTGAGVAVMPQSLARLYGRKGIAVRPITDLPETTIALVWPDGPTPDDVDVFIGVVRGRTVNSSRDRGAEERDAAASAAAAAKKAAAAAKIAAAKKPRRAARGPQRGAGRGGASRGRRS